jgi:hypothetical protein
MITRILFSTLIFFAAALSMMAQVEAVTKSPATDQITENLAVGSGKTLTIGSGGVLTVDPGATLTGVQRTVSGKGLSTEDYTTAEKTKLAGVSTGATANSTDAQLRDRATHTGTQAISTVSGLQSSLDERAVISARVNGPVFNGSQGPCFTTPGLGQLSLPFFSRILFDNFPTAGTLALTSITSNGYDWTSRGFNVYTVDNTLYAFVRGSTGGADYMRKTVGGFRSSYPGRRALLVEKNNSDLLLSIDGIALSSTEATGGTSPGWSGAVDFTRVDNGTMSASYQNTGFSSVQVGLGVLTAAEKSDLAAGKGYPPWCRPLYLGLSAAGTNLLLGDNSTFASDTGYYTKTGSATISAGVATIPAGSTLYKAAFFSAYKGKKLLVQSTHSGSTLRISTQAVVMGTISVGGGVVQIDIPSTGNADLYLDTNSGTVSLDSIQFTIPGLICEQSIEANVSPTDTTWANSANPDMPFVMPSGNWTPAVPATTASSVVQSGLNSRLMMQGVEFNNGVVGGNIPAPGTGDYEIQVGLFLPSLPTGTVSLIPVASNGLGLAISPSGTFYSTKSGVGNASASSNRPIPTGRITWVGIRRTGTTLTYSIDGTDAGTATDSYDYTASGTAGMGTNLPAGSRIFSPKFLNTTLLATERGQLVATGTLPSRMYWNGGAGVALITGDDSTLASDTGYWSKIQNTTISGGVVSVVDGYFARASLLRLGCRYRVGLNVTAVTGGGVSVNGTTVTSTTGWVYFDFTASSVNLSIGSPAGGSTFSLSDITLIGLGVTCEMDSRWDGRGSIVPDISGAGRHFVLPASGVSPIVAPLVRGASSGNIVYAHGAPILEVGIGAGVAVTSGQVLASLRVYGSCYGKWMLASRNGVGALYFVGGRVGDGGSNLGQSPVADGVAGRTNNAYGLYNVTLDIVQVDASYSDIQIKAAGNFTTAGADTLQVYHLSGSLTSQFVK